MYYRRAAVIAARILNLDIKKIYGDAIKDLNLDLEGSLHYVSETKEKKDFSSLGEIRIYVKGMENIAELSKKVLIKEEELREFYFYLYSNPIL